MSAYIVSYDLVKHKDYASLHTAIKSFKKWARITDSTWLICSPKKSTEIRDELLDHMDSDDRIFVIKSSGIAAWKNVACSNDFLKSNL